MEWRLSKRDGSRIIALHHSTTTYTVKVFLYSFGFFLDERVININLQATAPPI
jgi:hypothetical protein